MTTPTHHSSKNLDREDLNHPVSRDEASVHATADADCQVFDHPAPSRVEWILAQARDVFGGDMSVVEETLGDED